MKVAITGASGYVGMSLIAYLLKHHPEYEVVACVRESSDTRLISDIPVHLIKIDILDPILLEEIFMGVDVVVHTAALISYFKSDVEEMASVNVVGTRNVVNAALNANVRRLVHVSSVAAIGVPAYLWERDDHTFSESSVFFADWQRGVGYMASKYYAELEVRRAVEEGLQAVMINPGIILGEYVEGVGERNMLQFKKLFKMKTVCYPSGGTGFVDIEDVIKSIVLAIDTERVGERFIVVSENATYQHVFQSILSCLHSKAKLKRLPKVMKIIVSIGEFLFGKKFPLPAGIVSLAEKNLYYDNTKSKEELGLIYNPLKKTLDALARRLA